MKRSTRIGILAANLLCLPVAFIEKPFAQAQEPQNPKNANSEYFAPNADEQRLEFTEQDLEELIDKRIAEREKNQKGERSCRERSRSLETGPWHVC